MLKIKDDVNLKELEKFGFVFIQSVPSCTIFYELRSFYEKLDDETYIRIDVNHSEKRIIQTHERTPHIKYMGTTLFDLIQAGLIEKGEKE